MTPFSPIIYTAYVCSFIELFTVYLHIFLLFNGMIVFKGFLFLYFFLKLLADAFIQSDLQIRKTISWNSINTHILENWEIK